MYEIPSDLFPSIVHITMQQQSNRVAEKGLSKLTAPQIEASKLLITFLASFSGTLELYNFLEIDHTWMEICRS